MNRKHLNDSGFTAIEIVISVVLVGALGAAVYYAFQASNKSDSSYIPSSSKSEAKASTLAVSTSSGNLSIDYVMQAGWKAITGDPMHTGIEVTLDSLQYSISGAALAANTSAATADNGYLKAVTDRSGKKLYLVKTPAGGVTISSCVPVNRAACDVMDGTTAVSLDLMRYLPNSAEADPPIDWTSQSGQTAVADFASFASSLKL